MEKTVVIGVTGGIAAYKALDVARELKYEDIKVRVIMTKSAQEIVEANEFEKITGEKVFVKLFEENFDYKKVLEARVVEHIQLADSADVIVVAPATANIIYKLASGAADDYLTTTILAATCPIIICPSMNVHMWENPTVQENVEKLKQRGFIIVNPDTGLLACGYEGQGRLADIRVIKQDVVEQLNKTLELAGKKILITSGGTKEKIDDVRFITNRSSGKMGAALAEESRLRGADVLIIRAKDSIKPKFNIAEEVFETSDDLEKLINKYAKDFDVIFHVAAVSDFKIENGKDGKSSSEENLIIELSPRTKILDEIKKVNPRIKLVAFKAEHGLDDEKLKRKAIERLESSNADVIIANDVSQKDRGFESDYNEVIVIFKDGKFEKIKYAKKSEVSNRIFDLLVSESIFS